MLFCSGPQCIEPIQKRPRMDTGHMTNHNTISSDHVTPDNVNLDASTQGQTGGARQYVSILPRPTTTGSNHTMDTDHRNDADLICITDDSSNDGQYTTEDYNSVTTSQFTVVTPIVIVPAGDTPDLSRECLKICSTISPKSSFFSLLLLILLDSLEFHFFSHADYF